MNTQKVIQDLEVQNFECELKNEDGQDYFIFGIALNNGDVELPMLGKVADDILYISTIDMIDDATLLDLPYLMATNDLLQFGKLFLSTDINELEDISTESVLSIDYGFELMGSYYSPEMLSDYIQRMYTNLEDLLFSTE